MKIDSASTGRLFSSVLTMEAGDTIFASSEGPVSTSVLFVRSIEMLFVLFYDHSFICQIDRELTELFRAIEGDVTMIVRPINGTNEYVIFNRTNGAERFIAPDQKGKKKFCEPNTHEAPRQVH